MLDMDRFQHGGSGSGITRSLRREKSPRRTTGSSKVVMPDLKPRGGVVGDLLHPSDGAREGGNVQTRKQASALKAESDGKIKIPTHYITEDLSEKASGTPVKILMEKDMQNHVEARRHSPSVIAKLMGLDPLPAQQPCDVQKESVMCFHKRSSEGFPDKCISSEARKQEFKDIFEVLETKAVEKANWPPTKGLLNSKRRDKKMANARQKLMDAKHPSTDELRKPEERGDASEALDPNKDLCVKFLQEPTSLFERYLRDLHSVPVTPEASHITILKSSHLSKHESNGKCQKLERKAEGKTEIKRNAMHKTEADICFPSVKEHTASHSRKLSKSKLGGKTEISSLPTRIVVLKPGLENGQRSARTQGTSENFQSDNVGYKEQREFRSGSVGLFSDLRERRKVSDDVEMIHRIKGSREIAKEITKHMRRTVTGDHVSSYGSRHSILPGRRNLHRMPGASARTDLETVGQISGRVDGWRKSYSTPYLAETYASTEGRKHLSERWMMTHKFQEVGLAGHGVSTLGEMLALSDRETPDMHSTSLSCQERPRARHSGKEAPARWISPSGISSRDGWKNGCSSGLLRSKSLPVSSTIYGSPNSADIHGTDHIDNPFMLKDILNVSSRKFSVEKSFNQRYVFPYRDVKIRSSTSQPSSCDEEENKLPVREIHVDQNKLLNGLDSKNSPVEKSALSESSSCSVSDTTCLIDCMPVACDAGPDCSTAEQLPAQSLSSNIPAGSECSPANDEEETVAKETLHNQPEAGSSLSHTHCTGQVCSMIAKEAEQPSPISVLEPPDESECSLESFEKVSADLQELRMQLELLKLESRDACADRFVVGGNQDAGGEISDVQIAGVPPAFGDDEDREFSYLLSLLRDSGFHNADRDALFSAFYSPESPLCPSVFEKLEKIYSGTTWSRAERKLLFDVVNSVLAGIVAPNVDQHLWVKPRRVGLVGWRKNVAEEVWQSLVRQRTAVVSDVSGNKIMDDGCWLDLADDIDLIGREVESMLKNDLLEELISDVVSM